MIHKMAHLYYYLYLLFYWFSRLIRGVSTEIASSLYARDDRRTEEGKTIPKEILPLRRVS